MVSISLFSHSALSNKLHIQKEKERMRERVGWTGGLLFGDSEDVFPQMRFLSTADCNLPGQIRL